MAGEIINIQQMRAIDAACALAGTPTRTLMENAGRAVGQAVADRYAPRPIVVLCGPGANGGDGWVAARALAERGWPVRVETATPIEALSGDAADAARAWRGETAPLSEADADAELTIDALFGAGLARPLEGVAARRALRLAAAPERVVAIDVPSGLNADTGATLGSAVVRAALTVTFVRKKPAHVLYPGRAMCGEVVVADIGASEAIVAAQGVQLWENAPALWLDQFSEPAIDAHKHARGHAIVASGGFARTGAARLAARAALRAGAGLVTILAPREAMAEHAAQLNAIMLREAESANAFAEAAATAQCVVIGPAFGLTPDRRPMVEAALKARNRQALVLDADALTLLAPLQERVVGARDVLTPHVGEFRRAFPDLLEQAGSRIEAVRAAAARAGAIVLLKGPDTVIAAPDGRAIVNTTGCPYLATAGSGDVLAGLIAGLVAQGMESFAAAAAGAWLHGRAGECGGPGLIAEDLPELLPRVLNQLAQAR